MQTVAIIQTQILRDHYLSLAVKIRMCLQQLVNSNQSNTDINKEKINIDSTIKSLETLIKIHIKIKNNDALDDSLVNFLKEINTACHTLFAHNPSIWLEDDALARDYKTIFFSLPPEVRTTIGELYPIKKKPENKVFFIITQENKIVIVRPYPHFENIACEGGGVKGIAYGGVVKALIEKGIMQTIKCIAGSSAGAIIAALEAMGYSDKALKEQIESINFKELQDIIPGDNLGQMLGSVAGILIENYLGSVPANSEAHGEGFINSGRALLSKLRELIKTGIGRIIARATPQQKALMEQAGILTAWSYDQFTFANMADLALICPEENIKQLIVTGAEKITDSRTRMVLFSHQHSPRMEIALALRISASIPKFFREIFYNNKTYIDGGVEQNLPYSVFTDPKFKIGGVENTDIAKTIAFKFVKPSNNIYATLFKPAEEKSPKLKDKIFLSTELSAHLTANRQHEAQRLQSSAAPFVIPINNQGVNSTDFDLPEEMKDKLFNDGYETTMQALSLYMVPDRVINSDIKYNSFNKAIEALSAAEINYLIAQLTNDFDQFKNPEQYSSIFYSQGKPLHNRHINEIADLLNKLQQQLTFKTITLQSEIPIAI